MSYSNQMQYDTNRYSYMHEEGVVKAYYGTGIEQLLSIKREGRVPISCAWLMERRLATLDDGRIPLREENRKVAETYWNNNIDTGDWKLSHPDGRVRIYLDGTDFVIRGLQTERLLRYDGTFLNYFDEAGQIKDGHVVELTKAEADKYIRKAASEKDSLNNKFLRILARHPDEVPTEIAKDEKLLPEFVSAAFRLANQQYDYKYYFPKQQRAFALKLFDFKSIDLFRDYNFGGHRFLGIKPEALEITVKHHAA